MGEVGSGAVGFVAPAGLRLRRWNPEELAVVFHPDLAQTHLISASAAAALAALLRSAKPIRTCEIAAAVCEECTDLAASSDAPAQIDAIMQGLTGVGLAMRVAVEGCVDEPRARGSSAAAGER